MGNLKIRISGRISRGVFFNLKEDVYAELSKAIQFSKARNLSIENLLNLLLDLVQAEDLSFAKNHFESLIDIQKLQTECPFITDVYKSIGGDDIRIEEDLWYKISDSRIDKEFEININGDESLPFIEEDALISIIFEGNYILKDTLLKDFFVKFDIGSLGKEKAEYIKNKVKTFTNKNKEYWGLSSEPFLSYNKFGTSFLKDNFKPGFLKEKNPNSKTGMLLFDEHANYDYRFEADEFSFEDLTFLDFKNSHLIIPSAQKKVFMFMFYNSDYISPERDIYRARGARFHLFTI